MIVTTYNNHNVFFKKESEGVESGGKKVQGLEKR
jgi:hypothetical protein